MQIESPTSGDLLPASTPCLCFMPHGCLRLGSLLRNGSGCVRAWCSLPWRPVAVLCGLAALRATAHRLAVRWRLLVFMLGAWCALMEPHPAPAPALASLSDGLLRTVEGRSWMRGRCAARAQQRLPKTKRNLRRRTHWTTQRIDLHVSSVEVGDGYGGPAPMRRAASAADGALAGRCAAQGGRRRHFTVVSTFARPSACCRLRTYHDPGAWSREEYLLDQGITSTASVKIERVERLGVDNRRDVRACRISGLQHAIDRAPAWLCRLQCGCFPRRCAGLKKTRSCWRRWWPATAPT